MESGRDGDVSAVPVAGDGVEVGTAESSCRLRRVCPSVKPAPPLATEGARAALPMFSCSSAANEPDPAQHGMLSRYYVL